jgi:hypothetical protein
MKQKKYNVYIHFIFEYMKQSHQGILIDKDLKANIFRIALPFGNVEMKQKEPNVRMVLLSLIGIWFSILFYS